MAAPEVILLCLMVWFGFIIAISFAGSNTVIPTHESSKKFEEVNIKILSYEIRRSPYTGHWWVEQDGSLMMWAKDEDDAHNIVKNYIKSEQDKTARKS